MPGDARQSPDPELSHQHRRAGRLLRTHLGKTILFTDNAGWTNDVVSNVTYAATSSVVTLVVVADTNPPVLLGARSLGLAQVEVTLSKLITPATGTNPANYSISRTNGSVAILGATLDSSQTNALLSVNGLVNGDTSVLIVNNLAAHVRLTF